MLTGKQLLLRHRGNFLLTAEMWTRGEQLDDSTLSPLVFILLFRFLDGLSQALSPFVFFLSFFFRLDSVL